MGCSAGGHLTLALAQQLHATSQELPGSLTLVSPWVDLTLSFPSIKNRQIDFLTADWLKTPIKSLTRYYTPEAVRGPFFSPTLAPSGYWKFLEKTPVFVNVGEIEGFIDEVTAFVERIKNDDVPVTVNIVSDASLRNANDDTTPKVHLLTPPTGSRRHPRRPVPPLHARLPL